MSTQKHISLSVFKRYGGRIRVDEQFVVASIDGAELNHLLGIERTAVPQQFNVYGKEANVIVKLVQTDRDREGDVQLWLYQSEESVKTASGMRKVSINVYND